MHPGGVRDRNQLQQSTYKFMRAWLWLGVCLLVLGMAKPVWIGTDSEPAADGHTHQDSLVN